MSSSSSVILCPAAQTPQEMEQIRLLFREYAAGLGVDLSFQDFENELAALPGCYAAPGGGLFLAKDCGVPNSAASITRLAGCVGFRPFAQGICEMKRLFVRPSFRGIGLGAMLAKTALNAARAAGYAKMRLDTLPSMEQAMSLYRGLGFVSIAPYRHNPVPGTKYFEADLFDPYG